MTLNDKFKLIGATAILAIAIPSQAAVPVQRHAPSSMWEYELGENPVNIRNPKTDNPTLYLQVQVAENGKISFQDGITFTNHNNTPVETKVNLVFPNSEIIPLKIDPKGNIEQQDTLMQPIAPGEYYITFNDGANPRVAKELGYKIKTNWTNYEHTSLTLNNVKIQTMDQIQAFEKSYNSNLEENDTKRLQKELLAGLLLAAGIGAIVYNRESSKKKGIAI